MSKKSQSRSETGKRSAACANAYMEGFADVGLWFELLRKTNERLGTPMSKIVETAVSCSVYEENYTVPRRLSPNLYNSFMEGVTHGAGLLLKDSITS